MRGTLRKNPLVVLGVGLLVGTALGGALAAVSPTVAAAQLTLPIAVSLGLIGYGWYSNAATIRGRWSTVLRWTGYGVCAFMIVGFWFGLISRLFETSFLLAIIASVATGISFGATVGVYSARLQYANDELASQNDQLDQFISVVSHDLRNPLAVAKGRLDLAADECDSDHLDPASRSLDRMDVLIDDLLALARAGDDVREQEHVDLSELCHRRWQTVVTAAATLAVETDSQLRADPRRLEQLLENLFRNAVKHGGDDVTVRVGDLDDGFYVADDGSGIPETDREAVLEDGFSTSETGTGLGLAIVTAVAGGHGWDVTVTESTEGGARIEITGIESIA